MQLQQHACSFKEIVPACLLAGIGMIFAGTYVDWIKIQAVAAGSVISILGVLLFPKASSLTQYLSTIFNLMVVSILTSILSICTLTPYSTVLLTLVLLAILFLLGPWYLSRRLTSPTQASSAADLHSLSITLETFISSVIPLFCAIVLSSLSGQVLAHFAHNLPNLARLQIAINVWAGTTQLPELILSGCSPVATRLETTSIEGMTITILCGSILCIQCIYARLGLYVSCLGFTIHTNAHSLPGVGGCFGSIVVSRMLTRLHAHHKLKRNTSPPADRRGSPLSGVDQNAVDQSVPFQANEIASVIIGGVAQRHQRQVLHPHHQATLIDIKGDAVQVTSKILAACVPLHSVLALTSFLLQYYGVMQPVDSAQQKTGRQAFQLGTVFAYLSASFAQVLVVLHFARWIVITAWYRILSSSKDCVYDESRQLDSLPVDMDDDERGGGGGEDTTGLCSRYQASLASLDLTAIALTTGLGDLLGSVFLASALYYLQT